MKLRDNEHIRNFLLGSTKIPANPYVTDWQDPTYIGFDLNFNFLEQTNVQISDYESVSQCLLMSVDEPGSAVQYLYSINEPGRAIALAKFNEVLMKLCYEAPWHFQSISGLDKIYEIKPDNNLCPGPEGIITISMLEGFDLKVTMLKDLYRKASWDRLYHRWMLPENMRQFKLTITLTDMRDMQITKSTQLVDPDYDGSPKMFNGFSKDPTNKSSGNLTGAALDTVKSQVRNTISNLAQQLLDENEVMPLQAADYPALVLELSMCEFDVFKGAPYVNNISNTKAENAASQELVIKVGKVREVSHYDPLGIQLNDNEMREIAKQKDVYSTKMPSSDVLSIIEAKAKKKTEGLLNKLMLGNIYGISPGNLGTTAQRLVDEAISSLYGLSNKPIKIESNANLTTPTSSNTIEQNASLSIIENANELEREFMVKHDAKNATLSGQNIGLQTIDPHIPAIDLNIGFSNVVPHKPAIEKNIDLEEDKPKNIMPMKNIEFSGPPSTK